MDGFYWMIPQVLAGCPRPGLRWEGSRSYNDGDIHADLGALRARGIGAILSLTETALDIAAIDRSGLALLHLPVPDFTAPGPHQLRSALSFIDRHRVDGHAVAVHCRAGQGRTGTVLAAYLIRDGLPPDDAIDAVRAVCPHAIGSPPQEAALHDFWRRRDWLV